MKKGFTLLVCALSWCAYCFAQTTITICPTSFKRNNGNGQCNGGTISLSFASCPNPNLTIDSIYASGAKQNVNISYIGCSGGKAQYCFSGGNVAPANILQIFFSRNGVPGTGYNCYVADAGGGPTPVILSEFTAKRINNQVMLSWKTQMEENTKEFVLQRKTEIDFVDVATISASNNPDGYSYKYMDANAAKGISQYRLKMIDKDATFKVSEIKSVKGFGTNNDFIIYPNPSSGSAKISITDVSEGLDIQIIDNSGRLLNTINAATRSSIEINNLQKGLYLIRLINKETGEAVTKKLSVVN